MIAFLNINCRRGVLTARPSRNQRNARGGDTAPTVRDPLSTVAVLLFAVLVAMSLTHSMPAQNAVEVHMLPVQGSVYMLTGFGSNIAVQTGDDGVLVVDTGPAEAAGRVLEKIRQLSAKPIRYIINTHSDADHTGGNESIAKAGSIIIGGNFAGQVRGQGAAVLAHENVLLRMSAAAPGEPAVPFGAWPTDAFYTKSKDIFFNNEGIQILHQPASHTDGDSIVFFRRSDVISTGDVFLTTSYPVIDLQKGGTINGIIGALNRILELTIPKDKQEGGTMVIPGHGRLSDEADVVEYRDMLTIIRDRIQNMIQNGMTLEQVKAARPTRDYDRRYGRETGTWTTTMFVEGVYGTLTLPNGK